MIKYVGVMVLCSLAGFMLATVFMTPEGAVAGAAKGLFVGVLVAWGEWKSTHRNADEEENGIRIRAH